MVRTQALFTKFYCAWFKFSIVPFMDIVIEFISFIVFFLFFFYLSGGGCTKKGFNGAQEGYYQCQ